MFAQVKIILNYREIDDAREQKEINNINITIPKPLYDYDDFYFNIIDVHSFRINEKRKEIIIKMNNNDIHICKYNKQLKNSLIEFFKKNDPVVINEIKLNGN